MHQFSDTKGRTWALEINVDAQRRVKRLTGVDLFKLIDDGGKPLVELLGDLPLFVDVLFVLCQEQCKAQNVIDEDFGRAFAGDVIEAAADAFVDEVLVFTPNPRARKALGNLIQKGKTLGDRILTKAEQAIESLNPNDLNLDLLPLDSILKPKSGGSPANSAASTPGPSPSASST